jgi:transcriptional regulator with XRE-family HTH domain
MSRSSSTKHRDTPTTNLGHVLKRWRLIDDLGMREAAAKIGISAATLCRLEIGHVPDFRTMMTILNWFAQASGGSR